MRPADRSGWLGKLSARAAHSAPAPGIAYDRFGQRLITQ